MSAISTSIIPSVAILTCAFYAYVGYLRLCLMFLVNPHEDLPREWVIRKSLPISVRLSLYTVVLSYILFWLPLAGFHAARNALTLASKGDAP